MGALLPCPAARRSCALLSSAFVASSYDIGSINASADGVHIHTVLQLAKDEAGRLKISNITCNASIARMHAGFSGTLRYTQPHHSSPVLCRASSACAQLPDPHFCALGTSPSQAVCSHGDGGTGLEPQGKAGSCRAAVVSCRKVYEFLSTFIVTGMRFLLSQQVWLSCRQAMESGGTPPCPVPQQEEGPGSSSRPGSNSPLSPGPCLSDLPVPGACQPGAAELRAGHGAG